MSVSSTDASARRHMAQVVLLGALVSAIGWVFAAAPDGNVPTRSAPPGAGWGDPVASRPSSARASEGDRTAVSPDTPASRKLVGHVVDSLERPCPNVRMVLHTPSGEARTTVSDALGRVEWELVGTSDPGTSGRQSGEEPLEYVVCADADAWVVPKATRWRAKDVPALRWQLIAVACVVRGRVVDPEGRPAEGVSVSLPSPGSACVTGSDGSLCVHGWLPLLEDAVVVEFKKDGWIADSCRVRIEPNRQGNAELRLRRGASLCGRVHDLRGGVAGATVRALGFPGATSATDGEGRYRLWVQPDTELVLEASHPGHRAAQRRLRVDSGGGVADLTLETAARLRGEVLEASRGTPVGGARVELLEMGGSRYGRVLPSTTSDAAGRWQIDLPSAGHWLVTGSHREHGMAWEPVVSDGQGTITLRLRTGQPITGCVVDDMGRPIAGATVSPRTKGGGWTLTDPVESDAVGWFTLPACAGSDLELAVARAGFDGTTVLLDGEARHRMEIALTRLGAARGCVVDDLTGQAISHFEVALEPCVTEAGTVPATFPARWRNGTRFDDSRGAWCMAEFGRSDGWFRVRVNADGYRVWISDPARVGRDDLQFTARLQQIGR